MQKIKTTAWLAWLMASLFYAYQYVLRVMPNVIMSDIMAKFNIDIAMFGQFSGAYYIGYCGMHLPIGIMIDRYGSKKIMSFCIVLSVVGLLPIILMEHWVYAILGRFLIGAGSSGAILAAFSIIRNNFPEKHFTRMLSFCVTIGLIGAIYGGLPIGYLCENYGYKFVINFLAVTGLVLAIITFIIIPNTKNTKTESSVISDLKIVVKNKKIMVVCFLAGLMVGPMEGFADAWGSAFLKNVYGFETADANYLTSMIYTGMFFAPVLSRIAEKTNYYGTIAGAGFFMSIFFTAMCLNFLSYHLILIGLFIVGICCAYQIIAIYKASTYAKRNVINLSTAVANMIIMIFGYFFHTLIGLVINFFAGYGLEYSFIHGITVIPITLILGSIGFTTLYKNEKRYT